MSNKIKKFQKTIDRIPVVEALQITAVLYLILMLISAFTAAYTQINIIPENTNWLYIIFVFIERLIASIYHPLILLALAAIVKELRKK